MPKKLFLKYIVRQQIKNEQGFGWNVSEQSDKTKVVRRYEDAFLREKIEHSAPSGSQKSAD